MFTPLNLAPGFAWSPLLRREQSLEDKIGKHISELLRSEALPRFQPLIGPIAHTHNGEHDDPPHLLTRQQVVSLLEPMLR